MIQEEILHRLKMLYEIEDLVLTNYPSETDQVFYDMIQFISEVRKSLLDRLV